MKKAIAHTVTGLIALVKVTGGLGFATCVVANWFVGWFSGGGRYESLQIHDWRWAGAFFASLGLLALGMFVLPLLISPLFAVGSDPDLDE